MWFFPEFFCEKKLPFNEKLFASVAPLVKIISSARALKIFAKLSRACSIALRDSVPKLWREEAFPNFFEK